MWEKGWVHAEAPHQIRLGEEEERVEERWRALGSGRRTQVELVVGEQRRSLGVQRRGEPIRPLTGCGAARHCTWQPWAGDEVTAFKLAFSTFHPGPVRTSGSGGAAAAALDRVGRLGVQHASNVVKAVETDLGLKESQLTSILTQFR